MDFDISQDKFVREEAQESEKKTEQKKQKLAVQDKPFTKKEEKAWRKMAGGSVPAGTEEELAQIRALRDKILRYHQLCPELGEAPKFSKTWRVPDYEDYLTAIKINRRSKRAVENARKLFTMIANAIEWGCSIYGPDNVNLSYPESFSDNFEKFGLDVIDDDIREVVAEYPTFFMTPAILNICMTMFLIAQRTAAHNRSGYKSVPELNLIDVEGSKDL